MISEFPVPEYYVKSVDMNIAPRVGQTIVGQVGSELEMSTPTLVNGPEGFQCHLSLELSLYDDGGAPWQVDKDASIVEFGDIKIQAIVFLSGSHTQYRDYYETWSDGTYSDVDKEFARHLESGILQHLVNPFGELTDRSFNGLVPRMIFSPPETDSTNYEDL